MLKVSHVNAYPESDHTEYPGYIWDISCHAHTPWFALSVACNIYQIFHGVVSYSLWLLNKYILSQCRAKSFMHLIR